MASWMNLAGYQLVWLVSVGGAAAARPWLGVAAAAVFVAAQTWASHDRGVDASAMLLAIGLGIIVDGSLAASGLLRYAAPHPALGAPIWILAIWAAFALTLNHSLSFLCGRPALAALFGAVGGPIAYSAAARGFGAVSFAEPVWIALLALASSWAAAMALLAVPITAVAREGRGAQR